VPPWPWHSRLPQGRAYVCVCAHRVPVHGAGCWAVLFCREASTRATCLPRGAAGSRAPSQRMCIRGHSEGSFLITAGSFGSVGIRGCPAGIRRCLSLPVGCRPCAGAGGGPEPPAQPSQAQCKEAGFGRSGPSPLLPLSSGLRGLAAPTPPEAPSGRVARETGSPPNPPSPPSLCLPVMERQS